MRLSVIVSTYQSPEWLEKVLWGWNAQSHRDFELVVADDGSGPETARLLERVRPRLGFPLRHLWQEDKGFRKPRILNKAVVDARNPYLVFADGDCVPRADFLAVHAALARKGRFLSGGAARLSMVASKAVNRASVESGEAFTMRWVRAAGGCGLRAAAKLSAPAWARAAADLLTTTKPTWNGGNASCWAADARAANGFDERMAYGGEDREFGERLENAGVRGKCVRYRAACLHLEHARDYVDEAGEARNRRLRRRTRRDGAVRTPYGIDRNGSPR